MIVRKLRNTNAAVLGKDHAKKGLPCQDRTSFHILNGCYAIALSDGAGSRKLSHFGAEAVVKEASEYFSLRFDDVYKVVNAHDADEMDSIKADFASSLFHSLRDIVQANPDSDYDDYLCTLEFVVVKQGKYIAGHCGDGVIAVLLDEFDSERLEVLSRPENGDASNITFFINDRNSAPKLRFYCGSMEGVSGFMLMSDGPEEALYSKQGGLNPNAMAFVKANRGTKPEESVDFFQRFLSEKVARISYDDLSVNVLAYDEANMDELRNEEWCEEIFGNACGNQAIQESGYSFLLDETMPQDEWPMSSSDLADYLEKEALR